VLAAFLLGLSGVLQVDGLLSILVAGPVHNHIVTSGDRGAEVALGRGGLGFVLVTLLLRRLPTALALKRRLRATWAHVAWLGWFGPIGVAAVFYLGHADAQGVTDPRLWAAGALVITVSTLVHGLTAGPARLAYGRSSSIGRDAR
jgi:sodium/hydrogen antiporter